MLAQWTDKVVGQFVAFIDVAAYFAHEAFLTLGLRFWLHVALVVVVSHRLHIGDYAGFSHRTDEHAVGVEVYILLNLEGHERVDVSGQEHKPVVRAQRLPVRKLVNSPSALETEILKYFERCFCGQAVYIHDT